MANWTTNTQDIKVLSRERIEDKNPVTYFKRAEILKEKGYYKEAEHEIDKAIEFSGDSAWYYFNKVFFYWEIGEKLRALGLLLKIIWMKARFLYWIIPWYISLNIWDYRYNEYEIREIAGFVMNFFVILIAVDLALFLLRIMRKTKRRWLKSVSAVAMCVLIVAFLLEGPFSKFTHEFALEVTSSVPILAILYILGVKVFGVMSKKMLTSQSKPKRGSYQGAELSGRSTVGNAGNRNNYCRFKIKREPKFTYRGWKMVVYADNKALGVLKNGEELIVEMPPIVSVISIRMELRGKSSEKVMFSNLKGSKSYKIDFRGYETIDLLAQLVPESHYLGKWKTVISLISKS